MEQQDLEQRRAANLIWNAAQNYALRPGYMAFGPDGRADLYFNSVIGAVYQQYDFTPLEEVLRELSAYYGVRLSSEDTGKMLTAEFDTDEGVDGIVALIEQSLGTHINKE